MALRDMSRERSARALILESVHCPLHSLHERCRELPVQEGTIYTAILLGVAFGLGMEGKLDLVCNQCAADLKLCMEEVAALLQSN